MAVSILISVGIFPEVAWFVAVSVVTVAEEINARSVIWVWKDSAEPSIGARDGAFDIRLKWI